VKRFRFRLERLRRLRRVLDRQAREVLARAAAERGLAESSLEDLRGLGRRRLGALAELQGTGPLDPRAVLLHEADLAALGRRIDGATAVLAEAVRREEECAGALAEARRDLRVVETLRDRAIVRHRSDSQQEELAELDEHAARRRAVEIQARREVRR
jgi:flagellar export protein FliJ